ncbi:MAG: hypothetical protein J5730_03855 [Bacteroidales bacterium]|nr:hypothetical protein [Bacteroidales bacterium]
MEPTVTTYNLGSNSFSASYTFSAKEKDSETGLTVTSLRSVSSSSLSKGQTSLSLHSLIRRFGARYYSSDLSIWLSVDPMASKYPSLSPYVYCADNPVKLVDPNGEEIEVTANDDGSYTVVGGTLNKDRNIYIVKDGKRTGDVLGQTMTAYSFLMKKAMLLKVQLLIRLTTLDKT